MQVNTEISKSCANDQNVSEIEIPATTPHTSGEDENSVIIWYQNDDDNFSQGNINNNEDFIEIDIFPEWPEEQEELHNDLPQDSPHNVNIIESNISYSTFSQDSENFDFSVSPEMKNSNCIKNFHEILINHRSTIFSDEIPNINNDLKQSSKLQEKQKLLDSKMKYAVCDSINISCYIDGLVAILKIFNRVDCFIEKFAQITNNCQCRPSLKRGELSLSHYLIATSGAQCHNCSMDFILDKLNSIFLKNIARAEFIPVKEMFQSYQGKEYYDNATGATSNGQHSISCENLESGWLRRWLSSRLGDGVVAGIIYSDSVKDKFNYRPCNRLVFRLVTGSTDEEFQLTLPSESVRDEIIENYLLQEESINVLKSNILKCRCHHEDFENILKQTDARFSEMNVLGQIIGTLRERSSDSFRGFVPEEVHHIKIPNMHRNGVMLIVNI